MDEEMKYKEYRKELESDAKIVKDMFCKEELLEVIYDIMDIIENEDCKGAHEIASWFANYDIEKLKKYKEFIAKELSEVRD